VCFPAAESACGSTGNWLTRPVRRPVYRIIGRPQTEGQPHAPHVFHCVLRGRIRLHRSPLGHQGGGVWSPDPESVPPDKVLDIWPHPFYSPPRHVQSLALRSSSVVARCSTPPRPPHRSLGTHPILYLMEMRACPCRSPHPNVSLFVATPAGVLLFPAFLRLSAFLPALAAFRAWFLLGTLV